MPSRTSSPKPEYFVGAQSELYVLINGSAYEVEKPSDVTTPLQNGHYYDAKFNDLGEDLFMENVADPDDISDLEDYNQL